MMVLGGCSSKTVVQPKKYHNFSIYNRPPDLKLTISKSGNNIGNIKELVKKIKKQSNLIDNYEKDIKNYWKWAEIETNGK